MLKGILNERAFATEGTEATEKTGGRVLAETQPGSAVPPWIRGWRQRLRLRPALLVWRGRDVLLRCLGNAGPRRGAHGRRRFSGLAQPGPCPSSGVPVRA